MFVLPSTPPSKIMPIVTIRASVTTMELVNGPFFYLKHFFGHFYGLWPPYYWGPESHFGHKDCLKNYLPLKPALKNCRLLKSPVDHL